MIKKVKIKSIFVNEEKEITAKKDNKKYKLCEINVKIADDSKEYAGKYMKTSVFEYIDKKDSKKNRTATEKANYWKEQNDGKEVIVNITEREYLNKDGEKAIALEFKPLSKKEKEVAEQLIK